MNKLRIGIVGCGRISAVYLDCFKKLNDYIDYIFAVDKDISRAMRFSEHFGGGYSDNLDDLLCRNLDVVHICTPHFLHKNQVIACLNAGINVLCEKPMAITLSDAEEMIKASKTTGRSLGIIYQNRYIDGVQRLKNLIVSGGLGEIKGAWSMLNWHRPPSYYECDWKGTWEKEGGGVLIDQAIHSIDLVQWLIGSEVVDIQGHIDRRILTSIEVEDVADAAITFSSGARYSLFACNYYHYNAPVEIEIVGDKGIASIKQDMVVISYDGIVEEIRPQPAENISGESYWGNYHYFQIKECYDNFLANLPFVISGEDAKKSLEIVLGTYNYSRKFNGISNIW